MHRYVGNNTEFKGFKNNALCSRGGGTEQGLKNRVLASPKASSYIIGLVGIYLTVWELAHICQVSMIT